MTLQCDLEIRRRLDVPALLRLLLLTILSLAVRTEPTIAQQQDSVITGRIILFVSPDSQEVAALKQQMGEEDFYVAADDENWYRSAGFDLLDSLQVAYTSTSEKKFTFMVDGLEQDYDWSEKTPGWFVILYDGTRAPVVTFSVELPTRVSFLTE
ncbi:MAG: hypothetical protein HKN37_16510 [Rhodothermales bacterium]|nr:hypothetical protein [Rhodothermales bacterium]